MAVLPLVADTIVTRGPSAANSPRGWAMYSPAESTAGTAATRRLVFSRPPGAAELPPPALQPTASRALSPASAASPVTGRSRKRRGIGDSLDSTADTGADYATKL